MFLYLDSYAVEILGSAVDTWQMVILFGVFCAGAGMIVCRTMKVYALHDRFGFVVNTFRKPKSKPIPTTPIEAGVGGFPKLDWGDLVWMPFAMKVTFWNYWLGYGLDYLGLSGPAAVSLVQDKIYIAIVRAARFRFFFISSAVAMYAAGVIVFWLIDPERKNEHWERTGPRRYLLRYNEFVWTAGIDRIDGQGNPVYSICDEAGSIIVNEGRNLYRHGHTVDWWATDALWVQLLDLPGRWETFRWTDVFVEFIGMCDRVGATDFRLQKSYTDDFADQFDPLYKFPSGNVCMFWDRYTRFP